MSVITAIKVQQKRANRASVYLDGRFAFGCNKRVVERFGLKTGMEVSAAQLQQIQTGEIAQACFDKAMLYLSRRMHSRAELRRKLTKAEFTAETIEAALDRLQELNYLDDAEFARQKLAQAQRKLIGRRRAVEELRRSGVSSSAAQEAVQEHFSQDEARENARHLIEKNLPRLRRLEPLVAKRRLVGLLQRRGFDYDSIKPLIDQALGGSDE